MRRLFAVLAPLTTVCLAASGCAGSTAGSARQNGSQRYVIGGTYTQVNRSDLGSLDPYIKGPFATDYMLYDPLVNLRPDGKFVSGLATSWTVDATSANFTLRKGVTCSDGAPLTASQIAADINYVSDPKNASSQYSINTPTVPLTAVGDDAAGTVKVTLKQPFGFLLQTIGLLPIVCDKGMKNRKLLTNGSDGTGPYVVSQVVPGVSQILTLRKDYAWGPGGQTANTPGLPAKIVMKVVSDQTAGANLLLSGEVNMVPISSDDQERLTARGLKRDAEPLAGAWLWFNQRAGHATADKLVRQALVSALDIPQLVKVNAQGRGNPATGLVTRTPRFCHADTVSGSLPAYDVAAAGRLLDQAGWIKGADGIRSKAGKPLTIDAHYTPEFSSPLEKPTTELLAQQWKALGIKVKQASETPLVWGKTQESGGYDVYVQGYYLSLPSQLVPFVSGPTPSDSGRNFAGIHNKEYEQLAAKAAAVTPPQACTLWNQAERALISDLDIVPIAERPMPVFYNHAEAQSVGFSTPIPMSIRLLK